MYLTDARYARYFCQVLNLKIGETSYLNIEYLDEW